jgi:hypothetical protein
MALAYREMDPRVIIPNQQVTTENPYFRDTMAADQASTQRRIEAERIKGQAEAQKRIADVQYGNAWVQGLDSLVSKGTQGAQMGYQMGMGKRQQQEQELTGQSNRALQAENMASIQQARAQQEQRFPHELDQLRAGTDLTKGQIGLTEQQTTQAELQNQKLKAVALYENSSAAAQKFPGALEGESVMQYLQRNEAEGNVANTQMAKAQAGLAVEQLKNAPENQRLNAMSVLANIQASKAASANAAAQTQLAKAQFQQGKEVHDFTMRQQKVNQAQEDLAGFSKGLFSGQLYGKLDQGQATKILANKVNELYKQYGVSEDTDIAVGRALGRMASDQKSAQAADLAQAQIDPARQVMIEQGKQQVKLAMSGAQLLSALKAEQANYKGAGRFVNSPESRDAAQRIQILLEQAGQQSPVFQAYAQQFRDLNKGAWTGGMQGIKNVFESPQQALDSLIGQVSGTIKSQLEAVKYADPLIANTLNLANQNIEQKTNPFFDRQFSMQPQPQPQQSLMQPPPMRP